MNTVRREVLNGLFVLVISTLLSAAIAAFEIKFNLQLWLLIVMAAAIAVGGYVVFEYVFSAEDREKEWLRRVGTPARLELNQEGEASGIMAIAEAVDAMKVGSDLTIMFYVGQEGGRESALWKQSNAVRDRAVTGLLEQVKHGRILEYKRVATFDQNVLATDPELKLGVIRVGEGPGTIDRTMGEHCSQMLQTKGCSLYVAPAVLRFVVIMYGADKVSMTVETSDQETGGRTAIGVIFFCDPPNGEIVEQFRHMERATERRMVAVHKIIFPEDTESTAKPANSLI